MKIYIFQKNFPIFVCDSCFYATVQKFRLSDCIILLHAAILGMTLKGLVSACSQQSSFLVGKAHLRRTNACNHKKI